MLKLKLQSRSILVDEQITPFAITNGLGIRGDLVGGDDVIQ